MADPKSVHRPNLIQLMALILLGGMPLQVFGITFDPSTYFSPPLDRLVIGTYRVEKPSFYFVNQGLPPEFFQGVLQVSDVPKIYSIRMVEYGVRIGGWPLQRLFLQASLPYSSVYLESSNEWGAYGRTHELKKTGDLEISGLALLLGSRTSAFSLGLDGWWRLPTGTDPLGLEYPIMSTGKGASQRAGGLVAGQHLGRFSFFQGLNYENTSSLHLPRFYSRGEEAEFQWPDVIHAAVRIEYQFFKRTYRAVTFFYDLRMRQLGPMKYGGETIVEKDRFFISAGGLLVRVDPELSVEGCYSFYPFEFDATKGRPDFGGLLMISVNYCPI